MTRDNVIVQVKNEHNHPPLIKETTSRERNHQAESGKFSENIHRSSLEVMAKELPVEKS